MCCICTAQVLPMWDLSESCLVLRCLDPGILDPGSRILGEQDPGSGILCEQPVAKILKMRDVLRYQIE